MATVFPSEQWVKELSERLNNDPDYEKAASKWEGTFIFDVKPEEGLLDEEYILWMDPWHGKVKEAKRLNDINEEKVDYGLTGAYSVWKKIIGGELDPTKAMITGKLKVIGKMSYILRQKKASDIVVKHVRGLDVDFVS